MTDEWNGWTVDELRTELDTLANLSLDEMPAEITLAAIQWAAAEIERLTAALREVRYVAVHDHPDCYQNHPEDHPDDHECCLCAFCEGEVERLARAALNSPEKGTD